MSSLHKFILLDSSVRVKSVGHRDLNIWKKMFRSRHRSWRWSRHRTSKWMMVAISKKFPWGVAVILRSQEWDGRTEGRRTAWKNILKSKTDLHHTKKRIFHTKIYHTQHHSHRREGGDPHGHCHRTLHSSSVPGPNLLFPLDLPSQASLLWSEWSSHHNNDTKEITSQFMFTE